MPCDGPIHLRRASATDASGIAEVHIRAWRKAHAGLVPTAYLERVGSSVREESWRRELAVEAPDREPWVALVDDRIVGFVSAGLSREDDADGETGEVYLAYVDPECQGRGIGRNLLRHAVQDLRRHGFVRARFWVVAANANARGFAEGQGWRLDGRSRVEEYGDSQVELVRYTHALR